MNCTSLRLGFAALITICAAANAFGQYCVGYTQYKIRSPQGNHLAAADLPDLTFTAFDGEARNISFEDNEATVSYKIKSRNRLHKIQADSDISVYFGYCGQINDLTLEYRGMTMKLIFGIGILNTNFFVDALPFQAGTFRLSSLNCRDDEPHPMIDNEMQGVCVVPAVRWEKTEDEPPPATPKPESGPPDDFAQFSR